MYLGTLVTNLDRSLEVGKNATKHTRLLFSRIKNGIICNPKNVVPSMLRGGSYAALSFHLGTQNRVKRTNNTCTVRPRCDSLSNHLKLS